MRISDNQRTALRLGAVMLLLVSVVLAVTAFRVDSSEPSAGELTLVEGDDVIELPRTGAFGGQVVVYGATDRAGVRAAELGCRLLTSSGDELSRAKLSHLSQLGRPGIELDGETLRPLFTVRNPPPGAVVECTSASAVAPLAVATPSTFGALGGLVRAVAAVGAVTTLVLGSVALLVLRRRPA